MGSEPINPNRPGNEPELHLLLANETFEEPLWKHLFREVDEFFFPKKLPPLKLESKPEPVKDIWGFYNNRKNGALGSTGVHVLLIAVIIAGTLVTRRVVSAAPPQKVTVALVDPGDIPALTRAVALYRAPLLESCPEAWVVIATFCRPARASCRSSR